MKANGIEKKKLLYIFVLALIFRVAVYFVAALIMAIQTGDGGSFSFADFLNGWRKWDASHYIKIAENGYANAVEACETCKNALLQKGVSEDVMVNGQHLFLVFFPLYPWLMRGLAFVLHNTELAGLVVSSLTYALGCVYTYRLIRLDYSEGVAQNTVVLMSLFPFSFFYGGIMTEGLFLLLSAATLYYIRRHKWWMAILCGALATMTRTQGVLLGIPAGIEWLLQYQPVTLWKNRDFKGIRNFLLRGASLFLMLVGYGIYLLINWKVDGYPFSYLVYQKSHWYNGATMPLQSLIHVFQNAFFAEGGDLRTKLVLWIPEALIAVVAVLVFAYGIGKLKVFHMGYGVSYMVLMYSTAWLISAGRYTICCIPMFLVMALIAERKKWIAHVMAGTFIVLQTIFLTGFLNYYQIM